MTHQSTSYVHGYSNSETDRLRDQAQTLAQILHEGTVYPPDSRVLEVGCGIGAQTVSLVSNSPHAHFTCIDISQESLNDAQAAAKKAGFSNATFTQMDIFRSSFPNESFDHIFVCFVLEHLENPDRALAVLKKLLRPGGTITIIEGDHGSTFYHPQSNEAWKPIQCLIDLQAQMGGDSQIGRRLYPLLKQAGYADINVTPKVIYADGSNPNLVEGFTRNTYIAMVEGIKNKAVAAGMISEEDFHAGIDALKKTADENGTFCYTFFKAIAQ